MPVSQLTNDVNDNNLFSHLEVILSDGLGIAQFEVGSGGRNKVLITLDGAS